MQGKKLTEVRKRLMQLSPNNNVLQPNKRHVCVRVFICRDLHICWALGNKVNPFASRLKIMVILAPVDLGNVLCGIKTFAREQTRTKDCGNKQPEFSSLM